MILVGEIILRVTAELEFQKKYILQLKLLYIKMNADGHKIECKPVNTFPVKYHLKVLISLQHS